jgi:hypothetical protein
MRRRTRQRAISGRKSRRRRAHDGRVGLTPAGSMDVRG